MLYDYLYPEYYNDRNKCISSIIPRLEKTIKELEKKLNNSNENQSSNQIQELKSNLRCKKIIIKSVKYYFGL